MQLHITLVTALFFLFCSTVYYSMDNNSVLNMYSNSQLQLIFIIFIFIIQEIALVNGFICEDHDFDTNINFNILKICELYQTEIQDRGDIGPYDILILKEKINNVLLKISSLSENNSDFINSSENFIEDIIAHFHPSGVYSINS